MRKLTPGPPGLLRLARVRTIVIFLFCTASAIVSHAQTFKTLVNFDQTNGAGPLAALTQGTDGNYYGTTLAGGSSNVCSGGCGTIFKLVVSGTSVTLNTLHSFTGADGAGPYAALVSTGTGVFYGTTTAGGSSSACTGGCGTVFKFVVSGSSGTVTTLHNFNFTDGSHPNGLVLATDGNFYGTTWTGGNTTACPTFGCGTVFRITPAGTLTTLHMFHATDGSGPLDQLVQASNGNLYGTTRTPPHGGERASVLARSSECR